MNIQLRHIEREEIPNIKEWLSKHGHVNNWPMQTEAVLGIYKGGKFLGTLLYKTSDRPANEIFRNDDNTSIMSNHQMWEIQGVFLDPVVKANIPNISSEAVIQGNNWVRENGKTKDGDSVLAVFTDKLYDNSNPTYLGGQMNPSKWFVTEPQQAIRKEHKKLTEKHVRGLVGRGYKVERDIPEATDHMCVYPLGERIGNNKLVSFIQKSLYSFPDKNSPIGDEIENEARTHRLHYQEFQPEIDERSENISGLLKRTVRDPESGNTIPLKQALAYNNAHPIYRLALKVVHSYKRDPAPRYVSESIKKKLTEGIESHLKQRGVDPSKIKVHIDSENNIATFPIYNLSGQMIGYQRYNPAKSKDKRNDTDGKYFTYITRDEKKKVAVWGSEHIDHNNPNLFITEGIFDAIKLVNAGLPAVATLSNHPKHLKPFFKALGKNIIAVIDNDPAGRKLGSVAHKTIVVPEEFNDLGDMPQEEVNKFMATHGYGPTTGTRNGPEDTPKKRVSNVMGSRIVNPQTGNKILVKTALGYPKNHPMHIAAIQRVKSLKPS